MERRDFLKLVGLASGAMVLPGVYDSGLLAGIDNRGLKFIGQGYAIDTYALSWERGNNAGEIVHLVLESLHRGYKDAIDIAYKEGYVLFIEREPVVTFIYKAYGSSGTVDPADMYATIAWKALLRRRGWFEQLQPSWIYDEEFYIAARNQLFGHVFSKIPQVDLFKGPRIEARVRNLGFYRGGDVEWKRTQPKQHQP